MTVEERLAVSEAERDRLRERLLVALRDTESDRYRDERQKRLEAESALGACCAAGVSVRTREGGGGYEVTNERAIKAEAEVERLRALLP